MSSADPENLVAVPEKTTANELSQPEQPKSLPPQLPTFPDGGREAWTVSTALLRMVFTHALHTLFRSLWEVG